MTVYSTGKQTVARQATLLGVYKLRTGTCREAARASELPTDGVAESWFDAPGFRRTAFDFNPGTGGKMPRDDQETLLYGKRIISSTDAGLSGNPCGLQTIPKVFMIKTPPTVY